MEQEGRAILRYENEIVSKLAAQAMLVDFHGAVVPSVQSAVLTSQIGERLSVEHPFCVIWHDRDGRRYYSMRSREDGTDVGAIAASFGGGGHTHAAGFSISLGPDGSLPDNPALPRSVIDVAVLPPKQGAMIPLHDDNPTELTPVVTIATIAICVLVFLYQVSLPAGSGDTFVFQYGAIPALVFGEADLP